MPKERYTDRELALMADAAGAIEAVMERCDFRNLLYGKWSLLTGEIEQEHRLRDKERAEMFVAPKRQLVNLIRWNERRGWGWSDDDLRDIEREMPSEQPPPMQAFGLKAHVLEIHLPDGGDGTPGALRTFRELWQTVVDEQGARPFHLFDLWPKLKLKHAPGLRHEPGLRWRTIDFAYGWGQPGPHCKRHCGYLLRHLPPGLERPHAGLLSAAAHFPLWLKRMDGKTVPYPWFAGYEFEGVPNTIGAFNERLVYHPRLTRNQAEGPTMLYYGWDYVQSEQDAIPVYADTKTDP